MNRNATSAKRWLGALVASCGFCVAVAIVGCDGGTNPDPTPTPSPATPTPTPTPTPMPTPTPEPTPVDCSTTEAEIEDLNLQAEIVTIWGYGSMQGFRLRSVVGDQWYDFPDDFALEGVDVEIRSGPGQCTESSTVLCWTTAYVWNNEGDVAQLFDCDGHVVDELRKP